MSVPHTPSAAAILDRPERVCCGTCQLAGEPHPPAAAQQLAAEHDRIHHRGQPAAHTTEEPR